MRSRHVQKSLYGDGARTLVRSNSPARISLEPAAARLRQWLRTKVRAPNYLFRFVPSPLFRKLRLRHMNARFILTFVSILSASAYAADPFAEFVRKTDPLTAQEERSSLHAPPGFEIQ